MVSTPGPISRRRQLPAVPAGPEWHNTAASATPCATLRDRLPPSPHCHCPRHTAWAATGPPTQPGPHVGPYVHKPPNVFSSVNLLEHWSCALCDWDGSDAYLRVVREVHHLLRCSPHVWDSSSWSHKFYNRLVINNHQRRVCPSIQHGGGGQTRRCVHGPSPSVPQLHAHGGPRR